MNQCKLSELSIPLKSIPITLSELKSLIHINSKKFNLKRKKKKIVPMLLEKLDLSGIEVNQNILTEILKIYDPTTLTIGSSFTNIECCLNTLSFFKQISCVDNQFLHFNHLNKYPFYSRLESINFQNIIINSKKLAKFVENSATFKELILFNCDSDDEGKKLTSLANALLYSSSSL